jgi:hypothetical protein
MRIAKSSVTRTLLTIVVSGCIGGTGSGLVGVAGGNGGGSNTPPSSLSFFVQPNTADVGQVISPAVQIAAFDSLGGADSAFTGSITISLASNPTGATLSGTKVVRASKGIASFGDLRLDKAGTYTLRASTSGAPSVTSSAVTIATPNQP